MHLHAIDATVVPAQEPEDEVEEEDAIVEVTRRPARRGYPEPSFEGLEALRAAPKDYHELAAALASAGASIEGGERPLLDFRRDLITSARVAAVTITVHHAKRDRDIEIDEEGPGRRLLDSMEARRHPSSHAGDIAAQTAAAVREIRAATQALNPIKTKLRAFEGMKVSVPGGRVAIGVSKEAVYGRRPASSSNPTCERRGDGVLTHRLRHLRRPRRLEQVRRGDPGRVRRRGHHRVEGRRGAVGGAHGARP